MPTPGQGMGAGGSRRLGGWGFEGEAFPPSAELLAWLGRRLGEPGGPFPSFDFERFRPPPARPLPEDLAGSGSGAAVPCSTDPLDRLAHARGQGLPDLLRLRGGAVPALPDAVLRPGDDDEVERILRAGGGTLSHHHGVGSWHAPWYPDEVGLKGRELVAAAAAAMDPEGVLNPHVLLDPADRLEA